MLLSSSLFLFIADSYLKQIISWCLTDYITQYYRKGKTKYEKMRKSKYSVENILSRIFCNRGSSYSDVGLKKLYFTYFGVLPYS